MTVQRYRRKPAREVREEQCAARYEPGRPLGDLAAVARMAGDEAEVREVAFPSGKRVLLAWFTRYDDNYPPRTGYVTVEPGGYLAYSEGHGHLYATDDRDWEQFYDLVTGEEGP